MNNEPDIKLIEAFYHDQLGEIDRRNVIDRMEQDEAFRQLFNAHKYLLDAVEGVEMNRITDRLKSLDDAAPEKTIIKKAQKIERNSNHRILLWGAIAASLLAVVLIGFLLRPNGSAILTAENYYRLPNIELNRNNNASPLNEGMLAFSKKKWKEAESKFLEIPKNDRQYNQAQYYLAHVLIAMDQPNASKQIFNFLEKDQSFGEAAQWNYILSSIFAKDDLSTIQIELGKIIDDGSHFYQSDAADLLNDLKE